MRQQRTSQRRRNKPNPGGAQLITIDWTATKVGPNTIAVALSADPFGNPITTDGWTVQGIPQFTIEPSGLLPDSATIEPGGFELTYNGGVSDDQLVRRQSNLTDTRGPDGWFLLGKEIQLGQDPGPPAPIAIDAAEITGNSVRLTWTTGPTQASVKDTVSCALLNLLESPINITCSPGQILLEFATTPQVGDTIDVLGGATNWTNETGGTVTPFQTTLT